MIVDAANKVEIIEETPVETMDVSSLPTSPIKQRNQRTSTNQTSKNKIGVVESHSKNDNIETQEETTSQEMFSDKKNTTVVKEGGVDSDKQRSEEIECQSLHSEVRKIIMFCNPIQILAFSNPIRYIL